MRQYEQQHYKKHVVNFGKETLLENSEKFQQVRLEKTCAFELYVSTADKLAALIGSNF